MYAWGVGDGFAALVGKKYGKHKIRMKYVDHHKSIEGSAAMFITSALAVFLVMLSNKGLHPAAYAVIPIAGAGVATFVEMITKNGLDTITCPAAAMAVMVPLMAMFGGFS